VSLRWRLSLALALLAGVATAVTATIAYASTKDRLDGETDRFLSDRIALVRDDLRAPVRGGPRVGRPRAPFPTIESVLFQFDTVVQLLDERGAVSDRSGAVVLPIDAVDARIAAAGGATRYRTVSVEDVPYRVATVPVNGGGALQLARDVADTERVLTSLRRRFLVVGGAVVGAAVLLGWLIARYATKPLEQLTRTAEYVAGTGDLSAAPLPGARRDETGRLARAFTTMLDALSRSRAQQQQLVQDAGHELRTPLTSLRTNIEVLGRHHDLPVAQRAALLADVQSELGELSTMVDELVTLAQEPRDEARQRIDLAELVEVQAARAGRRHERDVRVSGHAGFVDAGPTGVDRAVANLLENAAKFSPPGTPIEVVLAGGCVTVRDHGPGLDPADVDQIFDRFHRAPSARALPGSGLGLAIVRQVVETNGGRVFAGNHPDGGAVVGFELPTD
jgi:two-component system, OmpR family, sensor histidine kinase MprB